MTTPKMKVILLLIGALYAPLLYCQSDSTSLANVPCCDQTQIDQKYYFVFSEDSGLPDYEDNQVLYDRLLNYMSHCSATLLQISCHTRANGALSAKPLELTIRAEAVANVLIEHGLSPTRIVEHSSKPSTGEDHRTALYPHSGPPPDPEQWMEFVILYCGQ